MILALCVTMFAGSTYAWFTDSVTSAGNKIQSGTLKVDLEVLNENGTAWTSVSDMTDPIFNYTNWEPGYTEVKVMRVVNEGTLALKWQANLIPEDGAKAELADVIDVYVNTNVDSYPSDRGDLTGWTYAGTLGKFIEDFSDVTKGTLTAKDTAGAVANLGIAFKMKESAGNGYMNKTQGAFDIRISAAQLKSESDSFGPEYDIDAPYSYAGTGTIKVTDGASAVDIPIYNTEDEKIGSVVIPAEALANGVETATANVTPSEYKANVTIAADSETMAFDITVDGLKENNNVPVRVTLKLATRLDPAKVKLYHYDTEIHATYDPYTGYVIFESATFSPFTVEYDAESEYKEPEITTPEEGKLPEGMPTATVTEAPQHVNVDLPWGSYAPWAPTEGLDSKLEAAYIFSCEESPAQAELNKFANWHCDFYVKLDKDLAANQIFLGGNYGSFGWVGFHNGEMTLAANTEMPLLGSVTSNPWTYAQVASSVGEFTCGVGDVNNALSGATFTVMLRLTNPENPNEFYNIQTINYTFQ